MPRKEMIPGERYRVHERIRALLLEVKENNKGPQIILSRAHRNFLRRLLENEVPEIYHGMIEIRSIAREPGQRSKVAVSALQAGVDPVGACVGMRGMRIQAIVRELNDEKIDVIEWNPDPAIYISKALSPARVTGVYLNERSKGTKTATVVVPEDQLSLAIGRDGQNARLAARLTSWKIDIKSLPEAASEALHKLQSDAEYAAFAELEKDTIPQIEHILSKKAEGRPVTPEEYQLMSQFVDRIERGILRQKSGEITAEEERQRIEAANIPDEAFEMPLEDLGLPVRYTNLLSGAGFLSVGDLMLQLKTDLTPILKLDGIGPKAMAVIEEALAKLPFNITPEEEVVEAEEVEEMPTLTTPETTPSEVMPETQEETIPEVVETTIPEMIAEETQEKEGEIVEAVEAIKETEPAEEIAEETEEEAEVEPSLEDLFKWSPEKMDIETVVADDEEAETEGDKKKKKKKKKYVALEFDPDRDTTIVKKKRKRGGEEWEDDWDV
jgi:N utilization substance protein A